MSEEKRALLERVKKMAAIVAAAKKLKVEGEEEEKVTEETESE